MPGYAYLDASAIVKLVVVEPETSALEQLAAASDGLVTSRLSTTEVLRAVRRAGLRRAIQTAEDVFESLVLIDVTRAVLARAAAVPPLDLRSLDAIHLATAASLDLPGLTFVTYDVRLAGAAERAGLAVTQPGIRRRG